LLSLRVTGGQNDWGIYERPRGARSTRSSLAGVFRLLTQNTDYQREAVQRLHLPFRSCLNSARTLSLPTFSVSRMTLLKRMALVIDNGQGVLSSLPTGQERRRGDRVASRLAAVLGTSDYLHCFSRGSKAATICLPSAEFGSN